MEVFDGALRGSYRSVVYGKTDSDNFRLESQCGEYF